MHVFSLVAALAFAASAYADCTGLPSGATDTVTGTFNLAAYNAATGATTPLNLLIAYVQPMTNYDILSTGSGQSNGFIGFTLSSGLLTATPPNQYTAPAHFIGLEAPPKQGSPNSIYPTPGPWLLFSNTYVSPASFCSVPNPSGGDNILAINSYTDLFSLCVSSFSSTLPNTNALLFNASSTAERIDWNTYDGSSCTPVTVLLVPS